MNNLLGKFTLIAFLLGTGSFHGCGSEPPSDPVVEQTGGSKGSGGKTGSGGAGGTGSGGAKASGGAGGASKDSGSASDLADGSAADAVDPSDDAPADMVSSNDTGAPDTTGTGGTPGSDAATGGIAACSKDPAGLTTCRQLEIACENCPPGGAPPKNGTAVKCFELVDKAFLGQATDAECVKFAADNKCTVDQGGNICVTLNCDGTMGCENDKPNDRNTCLGAARYGEKAACQKYVAKCPCK